MKRIFTPLLLCMLSLLTACGDSGSESPAAPSIRITPSHIDAPASGGDYSVDYTVSDPLADEWIELICTDSWISSITEDGETIVFHVGVNDGERRSGQIVVNYPGAEPGLLTVAQAAAEQRPEIPATEIVLEPSDEGWPSKYASEDECTIAGHRYTLANVANGYGNGIQFKKSSGYLANSEDLGPIRSLAVTFAGSSPNRDMSLTLGDAPVPSGEGIKGVTEGDVLRFDCSAWEYPYFTLRCGSGAAYVVSIEIRYGGSGGGTTPPETEEAPRFGTPAASGLSQTGATLACRFDYAGTAPVESLAFLYAADGGQEQRIEVADRTSGDKQTTLSGLTPSTRHTFRLEARIGDKSYSSTTGSFRTPGQSGGSADTRYAGWAELPAEAGDRAGGDYFYAYHLCPDYPSGAAVKARNFSTCYSKSRRCPVWVAAPLHDCYTGSVKRTNAYRNDPDIACTQAGHWDGYTRGHMLGSNERRVTTNVNRDVFYYSNIAPQIQTYFNTGGGQWNTAEDWVDKQWRSTADTLYQIAGSYWENTSTVTDGTTIPTHYYLVLLKAKKSARNKWVVDCSRDELQAIAILVRHKSYAKSEVVKAADFDRQGIFLSVARLEELTGHTFFANVPNVPKESYNTSDWNF